MWKCKECGVEKRATVHQMRHTYCSMECMSKAYKSRMAGADNPNYRDSGTRTCEQCGKDYKSYNKTQRYCSHKCYSETRPRKAPKPKKPPRPPAKGYIKKGRPPSKKVSGECLNCKAVISYLPSNPRKYCSYACHIADGGAQRAGDAAAKAKMKYGAKKDANHKELMQAIRTITAAHDLSNAGFGVPDGIAWVNDGWHLFDIKNPKTAYGRRGLNKRQKDWASDWRGGPVYLIYNVDEALQFARGEFEGLKRFPAD